MMGLTSMRSRLERLAEADVKLIYWAAILLGIGLVSVYSSSALLAQRSALYGYESGYFIKKQLLAAGIGLVLCVTIATSVSWKQIERFSGWFLGFSILCLALVFVPGIGPEIAGVNRWIRVAGFSFQPAEPAKLALILYLAKFIAARESRWIGGQAMLKALMISGCVAFLIYKEPDYSAAIFIMMLTVLMLFMGGISWSSIGVAMAGILAMAAYGLATKSYIFNRLQAYLNPLDDPSARGFQILQSYIALCRGGWDGVGFGNSIQKTALLPEPHTDFIYAVIGEEAGFIGTSAVAVLFLVLFVYGLRLALRMPTLFLKLATAGIIFMISIQALLNMAVVTGLMPVTGEPLPMISAGGSSLIINLVAIGCLLCFSREAHPAPESPGMKTAPSKLETVNV